jgi:hypothetical protein
MRTFLFVRCRTLGEIYNVVISTLKRHAPFLSIKNNFLWIFVVRASSSLFFSSEEDARTTTTGKSHPTSDSQVVPRNQKIIKNPLHSLIRLISLLRLIPDSDIGLAISNNKKFLPKQIKNQNIKFKIYTNKILNFTLYNIFNLFRETRD